MDLNLERKKIESVKNSQQLMKKWCFIKDDYFHGPYNDDELIELFLSNKFTLDDYILNKVDESWLEGHELSFLKPEAIQKQKEERLQKEKEIFEKNILHKITEKSAVKNLFVDTTVDHIQEQQHFETVNASIEHSQSSQNSTVLLSHKRKLTAKGYLLVLGCGVLALSPFLRSKYIESKQLKQLELLNQNQIHQVQSLTEKAFDSVGFQGKFFLVENSGQILLQFVSNVKSNIELNIKIEGIPSTLVGAFTFNKIIKVAGHNGIFEPIKLSKSIPKGEYRITALCYDCKSIDIDAGKEMTSENMFLNGLKDKSYDRELTKYHQIVRTKAKDELIYFNQVMNLFRDQLDTLSLRFGNNINQKIQVSKYWDKYYSAWLPLSNQFDSEMERLKSEVESGEIFYDEVVADLQNLNHLTKEYTKSLDTEIRVFFKTQHLTSEQEKKIEKLKDQAFKKLNQLSDRITSFEKMPLTANGMPQKN